MEISIEEFEQMERVEEREILEVDERFWRTIDEDLKELERERKRRNWEWKKQRDEWWREREEGRVLDYLVRVRRRFWKKCFKEYVEEFRRELGVKYSKVMLRNVDNKWYKVEYLGKRRDNGKIEKIDLKGIVENKIKRQIRSSKRRMILFIWDLCDI